MYLPHEKLPSTVQPEVSARQSLSHPMSGEPESQPVGVPLQSSEPIFSRHTEEFNTHQKALAINLDPTSYGSFAEIGAGQEVARWFLVVGGASGTVAKSISAYDKEVSDDLYGSGARYVSKERLQAMLNSEWAQLTNQLSKSRGSNTRFFSFVDTISARNYAGTNEPHGWVGLRFQVQPGGEQNDIVLHINMRDSSNALEQEAIGVLGVNLIYAAFYKLQTIEFFLGNVAQGIERRIEIDYVEVSGGAFEGWDQREILMRLVRAGLAEAVCFLSGGTPAPPIEVLHKKAAVLAPGSFEHADPAHAAIHEEMLASGVRQLREELNEKDAAPAGFFCLSATPLIEAGPPPEIPDLLERINALQAGGGNVLLFRERELYSMTDFVNRYTRENVRFVLGLSLLVRVWEYRYSIISSPGTYSRWSRRIGCCACFSSSKSSWVTSRRGPRPAASIDPSTPRRMDSNSAKCVSCSLRARWMAFRWLRVNPLVLRFCWTE